MSKRCKKKLLKKAHKKQLGGMDLESLADAFGGLFTSMQGIPELSNLAGNASGVSQGFLNQFGDVEGAKSIAQIMAPLALLTGQIFGPQQARPADVFNPVSGFHGFQEGGAVPPRDNTNVFIPQTLNPPVPQETQPNVDELIDFFFGAEANRARNTLTGIPVEGEWIGGENAQIDPEARNKNRNGSVDLGIFQINSNTYKDFKKRRRDEMAQLGINKFSDLKDPMKNVGMAKMIWDEQGWNAWYGSPYAKKNAERINNILDQRIDEEVEAASEMVKDQAIEGFNEEQKGGLGSVLSNFFGNLQMPWDKVVSDMERLKEERPDNVSSFPFVDKERQLLPNPRRKENPTGFFGFEKKKIGGDISTMGYRDDSPYRNSPYLDILGGNIDMSQTGMNLLAIPDVGAPQILQAYSGLYSFPEATTVREIPINQR